jgi:hypothetical protein
VPNAGWVNVFSDPSETNGGKMTGKKLTIEWSLEPRTEHSRVDCTVFIAAPKTQKVVNECGGAASDDITGLVSGRDFVLYDGKCLMNTKRWHIKSCKRQTILPIVTESGGTEYINSTVKNRHTITGKSNLYVNSSTAAWNTVDSWDLAPGQRWQIYVFNNNTSSLEGSPQLRCHVLFSGHTSG